MSTEVDAITEMLAAIGEDPVGDLNDLPPSGATALATLRATTRDFLEEGHWFNREEDYTLTPNENGEILIPDNILAVDGMDDDVVERRPRLYHRERKSFTFEGPVSCEVHLSLDWDEMPLVARRYITALATEIFVDGFPSGPGLTPARQRALLRAKAAFENAVVRNEDLNILNNTSISSMTRR